MKPKLINKKIILKMFNKNSSVKYINDNHTVYFNFLIILFFIFVILFLIYRYLEKINSQKK